MDTPERTMPAPQPPPSQQAGTPGSRVENSPVFNFINNLSPIKPVKSLRITQSFQTLSFPSIPSIFSSPHVNSQKERKFVLRPHISSSKSDNGDGLKQSTGPLNISKPLDIAIGHKYSFMNHPPTESADFHAHDYPVQNNKSCQSLHYDCGSPNHSAAPFYDTELLDSKLDLCNALTVDYVPDDFEERENCIKSDLETEGAQYLQQDNETTECEWETMISEDAENLLVLDSCTEAEVSQGHPEILEQDSKFAMTVSDLSEETLGILQNTQAGESSESCIPTVLQESLGNLDYEAGEQNMTGQVQNAFPADDQNEISNPMKVGIQHQRGMLRRCLLFDMAGGNRKNTCIEMRKISSPALSCQEKNSFEEKPNSPKTGACPLSCALPSIGLHLNSLASTSKDGLFQRDLYPSDKGQMSTPSSVLHLSSVLHNDMPPQVSTSIPDGQSADGKDHGHLIISEISLAPESQKGEEMLSSSPKKKKRKLDNNTENEGCKRCNCKKSKCLKLYCECFAAGVYCVEPCSCQGCFNKPMHEDTVLATRKLIESRNPIAFAPKVIRPLEPASEVGEEANKTPASARHKRGCNCKKSSCLKKYCECFQGGAGCSINCRCEGCKNPFGTKYGKLPVNCEEIENESEEMDTCDIDGSKSDSRHIARAQIGEQHNPESVAPITPSFSTLRASGKPPFPSTGKPPRSTVLVIGSSPRLTAFKTLKKPEITPCHSISMEHSFAATVDETPDILKSNAPSKTAIKISSPSQKRISPPHNETAPSPSRKGSRKLILKSIPSFPSLVSETINDESCEGLAADILSSPQLD